LPERLRDIASTLERHGWLRDKGERPVYWVEKAADRIDRLERERDGLRVKVEAARKILEPMADCDPDIREWLGLPRFGDALRSPEDI
jgi:hypothetical protein